MMSTFTWTITYLYEWGQYCKHKVAILYLYHIKNLELYKEEPEQKTFVLQLERKLAKVSRKTLKNYHRTCQKKFLFKKSYHQ